jgi:hypothetical protein
MKMKISKGVQFWTEHLAGVKREGLSLMGKRPASTVLAVA